MFISGLALLRGRICLVLVRLLVLCAVVVARNQGLEFFRDCLGTKLLGVALGHLFGRGIIGLILKSGL